MPANTKPAEVVAKAAEAGFEITAGLVHTVRAYDRKKAAKAASTKAPAAPAKRRGRPPKAAQKAAAAPAPAPIAGASDRERQLVALAVDVGLARSIELIQALRAKLAALF